MPSVGAVIIAVIRQVGAIFPTIPRDTTTVRVAWPGNPHRRPGLSTSEGAVWQHLPPFSST